MLQVRKLHIAMKKDLRELVRDFTFALNPGDKAAIIGEEGNGKSTLLKLIYDENLVEGYVEWSGTIQKDGMILGYLSQELPEEDRDKTAYEFCCGEEAFLDSSPKRWRTRRRGCGSRRTCSTRTGRWAPSPAGRR